MEEKKKKEIKYKLTKWQKVFLLLCLVSLLTALVLRTIFTSFPKELQPQYAWERFKGKSESKFSQVAVFLTAEKGKAFTYDRLFELRSSYKGAFSATGKAEEGENVWVDAFSSRLKQTVKSEKDSAEAVAFAIGGDFFMFHPLMLKSGGYISESDFMHDGIVVDEVISWKLFGGTDTAGKTVYIGDKPYIIRGVVSLEKDKASRKVVEEGVIFMHFDAADKAGEERLPIECYEFVGKEPIKNFCQSLMNEKFKDAEIKKVDGRFSPSSVLSLLGAYSGRGVKRMPLYYPYWENAAVINENRLGALLLAELIFFAPPVILALYFAYKLLAFLRRKLIIELLPRVKNSISEALRKRQRARVLKKKAEEDEFFK